MRSTTAFAYWTAITALPVSVSAFQPPPLPAEQGPKVINVTSGNPDFPAGIQGYAFTFG